MCGLVCSQRLRTTGVPVLADDPAVAAGRVDVELLSHQVAEAGRVQVGAGADDAVTGEAAQLPRHVRQDVHWRVKKMMSTNNLRPFEAAPPRHISF